jgi:hypothetical protein
MSVGESPGGRDGAEGTTVEVLSSINAGDGVDGVALLEEAACSAGYRVGRQRGWT